jgi:hypothetical protein
MLEEKKKKSKMKSVTLRGLCEAQEPFSAENAWT